MGKMRHSGGPTIWLHGASVGEIGAAVPLLEKITESFPEVNLVVTTVTEQGLKMARKSMGNTATCLVAPLDVPGAVTRAIRSIKPDIYLCLETELWPNTLAGLRNSGATCFLLNARMSEKSFRRYRRLRGFTSQVLAGFTSIAAITNADAIRLIDLGAAPEKVTVCGNLKYDLPPVLDQEKIRQNWQKFLALTDATPVLMAGSTHSGEEVLLLKVFVDLKRDCPGLLLILAPRHLSRLGTIAAELSAEGADYDLLSQIKERGRRNNIVIIDSMGDLPTLYSVATYVFCGGSLVERGGHNIMEAARWGRPVFYGPSMKDFADAKELLEKGGGGFQVDNAGDLRGKIRQMTVTPELYQRAAVNAARVAAGENGATDRQLQPVRAVLQKITKHD